MSVPHSQIARPSGNPDPGRRKLDSWKEIASYLGRQVRTVQRWEKFEGLPVRRLHHQDRGSVYAIVTELDAWVASRETNGRASCEGDVMTPAGRAPRATWAVAAIFAVTLALAATLLTLARSHAFRATAPPTPLASEPPDASYLRGMYLLNLLTEEGISKSIPQFQQTLAREPRFAPAFARLAEAHTFMSFGSRRDQELASARELAEQARRIDDSSAEVHESLALIAAYGNWDWSAAEAEYKRALQLAPGLATVHSNYAQLAAILGRSDLAISEARLAWELQPLSPTLGASLAWYLYWGHRFDEAIATSQQVLRTQPGFASAQSCIVRSLVAGRKFEEARAQLIEQLKENKENWQAAGLNAAPAEQAVRNFYQWKLARLKLLEQQGEFPSFELALTYAALGDKEALMDCLEKSFQQHKFIAMLINAEPYFDAYRSDPRFAGLARKMGLPAFESKAGVVVSALWRSCSGPRRACSGRCGVWCS